MLITTSITAVQLIPQNRLRKSLIIQNVDASITVFVKRERNNLLSVTTGDYDLRLGPGASLGFNSLLDGTEAIQDRYSVVAASGTPVVAVFETEDFRR